MAKKFLDLETGLPKLWSVIKSYVTSVKSSLESSISGKQDTLVSGTSIKTINSQSLLGSGDITIDLTLFKVVSSLPTSGIDETKIYLIKSSESGTSNIYTEYIYANSAWEKLGEYKSDVDLSDYAKTADVETALAEKADADDTYTKSEVDAKITASGTFDSSQYYTKTEVDALDTALKAVATTSANGMMSSSDKTKLDAIASGAEVNQNAFSNVVVGSTTIAADGKTDTLTIAAGSNITLTPDATNDKLTIAATDTTYSAATTSAAGLMSASDKTKLDSIASGATAVSVDDALSSTSTNPVQNKVINTALAGKQATLTQGDNITISGTTISAKDTHYTSKNVVGGTSATSNTTTALTNGNVYLNSVENGSVTSSHKISGSGSTTVTTDASGNIVITSTDNNTDIKVLQNAASSSTTGSFNLLLARTAGSTTAETGSVNKAASLTYVQTTGTLSTTNVTASSAVTGATIVKSGGTSDQILLADGTVAGIISEAEIEAVCV